MRINEVERLVGITKKNIRFYEQQGLLKPGRDLTNGYREYRPEDVKALQQIKLMRKLGIPLEEIRRMQAGTLTVGDAVERHLVTLRREEENLRQSRQFCEGLRDSTALLGELDAAALLGEMARLEQTGAVFRNSQQGDFKRKLIGPVLAAAVMVAVLVVILLLILWGNTVEPMPKPLLIFLLLLLIAVAGGVVLALCQRIGELRKGEDEDAKRY